MKNKLICLIVTCMMISAVPLSVSAGETDDIPTNAANTGVHNSLVAALSHADLVTTLEGTGPFTVFAPTDEAFANAGIDLSTFDTDEENAILADILLYHVVSGSVASSDLTDGQTADAVNGDKLSFTVGDSVVKVNDATVTTADVISSNGIIHVIDKVLLPPVDVYVSDGTMAAPYFDFYTDSAATNALTEIDISKAYNFQRISNPSAHPFYIGDTGYNTPSSSNLIIAGDGSSSSGISDDQSFTVFFRDGFSVDDTLSYYCTVHSNMIGEFALTAPVTLADIPTVATGTGVHDYLVDALSNADLVSTLQGAGPFTVFAPTDQAFIDAGIDPDDFVDDQDSIDLLSSILLYHVYSGYVASSDVTDGLSVTMVNGESATFTVTDKVMIGDATVTTPDVAASNGIIHVIDQVLIPPSLADDDDDDDDDSDAPTPEELLADSDTDASNGMSFDEFSAFIGQFETYEQSVLDNLSEIFASHDEDDSGELEISELDGFISEVDLYFELLDDDDGEVDWEIYRNGYCEWEGGFGIDAEDPENAWYCKDSADDEEWDTWWYYCELRGSDWYCTDDYGQDPDFEFSAAIPAIASSTGIHASLVAAVAQADLVSTLNGAGPFTVFAPTDEAFTAAGIDLSAFNTVEEIATLADILTYHVVPGSVMSSDLTDGMTATAVNSDAVTFTVNADGVKVNDANVVTADVPASNGVIHVIDKVLMPPADLDDIPTIATGTGIHTALVAALGQANLVTTLQGDGPFTVFAPTDEAFTAAGIDLSTFDTDEEIATLVDILTYHVVSGNVLSTDLTDGMTAPALNTDILTFTVNADGVKVNDANVVSADVAASNGVIHVIDKVLMPPTDLPACDYTVGIGLSGMAFNPSTLKINVGETVCWQWTESSMAHNVKEVDGDKSSVYVEGGISSGAAETTVDFRHTFTEDSTTFYYVCEPHIMAEMYGKVIVGDGGVAVVDDTTPVQTDKDSDSNTPGFLSVTAVIALIGALLFTRNNRD